VGHLKSLSDVEAAPRLTAAKGLHNPNPASTSHSMSLETSLILFKPDAIKKNLVGSVLARFQEHGFVVRGIKMIHLSDEILAEHYSHIADKPFFPSVRNFMQETPVIALALEGENVISRIRDLLGPTDSMVAAAGTIRGDFGFKDADAKMRNVCHASDSVEAAQDELKRFFKDGEIFAY
jgi:nucleoside-diphosphate kinase